MFLLMLQKKRKKYLHFHHQTTPMKPKTIYYLLTAIIFITLKFTYTVANSNHLNFLLKPTNKLIEFLTGSNSIYFIDKGYYYESLNIMIDKSCSGFNFLLLSFALFMYLIVKSSDKHLYNIIGFPIALAVAYLLTIFVNASRIFASIVIQSHTDTIFYNQKHLIHEAIGITTNLTFLILAYCLINKLIQNNHLAKSA